MTADVFNLGYKPLSPWIEMGAYEALWDQGKMWFKGMSELFASKPGALPSDFFSMNPGIPLEYADRVTQMFERKGVRRYGIRLHGDGEYPHKLRSAKYPVEMLYYRGYWGLAHTKCIAIVGTRKPSADGLKRAERLSRLLAQDGFTIISGLAEGIDTAAHTAAIAAGKPTIAVIGTPISEHYPKTNSDLQDRIAQEHLLISQVPVCRYADRQKRLYNKNFFPERNVTMSALSEATIIVEAGETSGTLVQARAALEQKRKLFILDSCFKVNGLTWPLRFEQRGAIRVRSYTDIRKHL